MLHAPELSWGPVRVLLCRLLCLACACSAGPLQGGGIFVTDTSSSLTLANCTVAVRDQQSTCIQAQKQTHA